MANYSVENISNNSTRRSRTFRDIDLDFNRNTVTNDVNKLSNEEAIKRSVRNLIQTNHFERPFHPEIGSNVRALLFEPVTPLTALNLQRKIEEVIINFEPRVRLAQIVARPDIDNNRYAVSISFYIIGSPLPVTVETFLERLR